MRIYLVDATNAARRQDYSPGFPAMEDIRTREFIARLAADARGLEGRIAIELFFDGPRRDLGNVPPVLELRFSGERQADDLILGTVRALRAKDRGVVVATEDSTLRREVEEEGGRVIGFGELFRRLQAGRA
jgi:hypothetical protein